MKIIHTSDWHLGQNFMGKTRQAEHEKFLAWLISLGMDEGAEAIIVAGDIFDTGSPPSYARELYSNFIVSLQQTGMHLIILGGNHDSVATLSETKSLLAQLNTHVVPGLLDEIENQVITLRNPQGDCRLIVCAVPFLRSRNLMYSIGGQSGSQKQLGLQQAIAEHYQKIFALAQVRRDNIEQITGVRIPIVATGHLTTVGATSSDSVREIYIGSLEAFPSTGFPPADYVALGHIHRMQKVGGSDHIRYSGSPIPLSFDELKSEKKVLLVEFTQGELTQVTPRDVPCFQKMASIKGDLLSVETQIGLMGDSSKDSQEGEMESVWLDIEISAEGYLDDLQQRVESMIEGSRFEILLLRRERTMGLQGMESTSNETLKELSPQEVFERRLAQEDWTSEDQQKRKLRMTLAFDEVLMDLSKPVEDLGATRVSDVADHGVVPGSETSR
ncbi:MAG: exonuclease subunit SbcD [Gammaproteobacteria bacterium]|nr:exonuclease subunit SbcD [Gammaproteobacteria bacterium]